MNENYQQFVDRAHEWACGIYKTFPGALVPKVGDAGYKSIWDDLCFEPPPSSLPGLPPPPASAFQGGQCCNLEYKVVVRFDFFDERPDQVSTLPSSYQGQILGIEVRLQPQGDGTSVYTHFLKWKKCDGRILQEVVANDGRVQTFYSRIEQVYTTYGVPDTCGNPPKEFPPSPPPPPEGYKSPPIVITNNDGDEYNYTFNLFPPSPEKYPNDPLPPITVKVEGDDNSLKFDIDFNFGGDISFNSPGSGGGNLPSGFNSKFVNLGGGIAGVGEGVAQLGGDFGFNFNPPNFATAPDVEKEEKEVADGGEEEGNKEGLLGVLVELTKPPTDVQFGTPNVNFAGWFTFLVQGGYAPREPINFEKGYFIAPPGSTGYALTFTKGAEGRITVYSKED